MVGISHSVTCLRKGNLPLADDLCDVFYVQRGVACNVALYSLAPNLKFFGPCSCPDGGSDGVRDDGDDAGGGGVRCTVCRQAVCACGAL